MVRGCWIKSYRARGERARIGEGQGVEGLERTSDETNFFLLREIEKQILKQREIDGNRVFKEREREKLTRYLIWKCTDKTCTGLWTSRRRALKSITTPNVPGHLNQATIAKCGVTYHSKLGGNWFDFNGPDWKIEIRD